MLVVFAPRALKGNHVHTTVLIYVIPDTPPNIRRKPAQNRIQTTCVCGAMIALVRQAQAGVGGEGGGWKPRNTSAIIHWQNEALDKRNSDLKQGIKYDLFKKQIIKIMV